MMQKFKLLISLILLGSIFSSCVSTSKYQQQVDENKQLSNELRALKFVDEQNKKLTASKVELEEKLEQTEEVMFQLNNKYNGLKQQHESLQKNYDDMLLRNQDLLEKAFADKTNLTEELIAKQAQLNEKENALNKLEKNLSNERMKLEISQQSLASRQQRIDSLTYLLESNESKLTAIQGKIADILKGYSSEEIAVEKRKDGRLYISLSQNLLFKKGSDQLDWKGKSALQKLAKALNSDPSIQIIVEGHTDSDGGQKLNWKLSADRALAVVDVLITSKVMPQRIIAAGRGQFHPLLPNTSEENKSKNRRTEIILSPNLEALQELLQSE
jgi:chemotaxis protein MotB